jgi:hypothetical protein
MTSPGPSRKYADPLSHELQRGTLGVGRPLSANATRPAIEMYPTATGKTGAAPGSPPARVLAQLTGP